MTLEERIARPGPKKILALDGGGILGLMSVEVLIAIEDLLRKRAGGGADFVLADFFDLVAGTSTGAVIASCISLGLPMRRIRQFYIESGADMFDRASLLKRFYYKFEDEKLSAKLQSELGPERAGDAGSGLATLGSPRMKTLFMAVTRNATTDSPWPFTNNPRAKYNQRARPDCNLLLPLWKVVRASTAAPTFFPPEVVDIGPRRFVFVDGGVTTYNNPAFLAFVTATAEPYRIGWSTGLDQMLVVSIGTGSAAKLMPKLEPGDMHLIYQASNVPGALMNAAAQGQDLFCRTFGRCLAGPELDREVGTMINATGPAMPKLFTYLRYDADVSREGLDALGLADVQPEQVQLMDSVEYIPQIQQVGIKLAARDVKAEHYAAFS